MKVEADKNGYHIELGEQEAYQLMTLDSVVLLGLAAEIMKVMEKTKNEISDDKTVQ